MERKPSLVRLKYQEILEAFSNDMLVGGSLGWRRRVLVGWKKPPKGRSKLNMDGGVHECSGIAGARGVLRNEEGLLIHGFSINLGCCSVQEAELWAVLHGLGWSRIQVQNV